MNPRGKVKQLIDAMEASPGKALWTPEECAEIIGASVSSSLSPAVRHGWLDKHHVDGRRVAYSLPGAVNEEVVEPDPFLARLDTDGDLDLYGLIPLADGGWRIEAANLRTLCRLLHGQGPEE